MFLSLHANPYNGIYIISRDQLSLDVFSSAIYAPRDFHSIGKKKYFEIVGAEGTGGYMTILFPSRATCRVLLPFYYCLKEWLKFIFYIFFFTANSYRGFLFELSNINNKKLSSEEVYGM